MNLLKSQFNGTQWNGYDVVPLKISELWASVPKATIHRGKEFYGPILNDIKENGLHFPLLVVHANKQQIIEQKNKYGSKLCNLPFNKDDGWLTDKMYVVWGGSNRVRIAEELGYEYIDCCIVAPNGEFEKARGMQKMHREPYQGKYY
jgi:hypothetical protein|tara:strand:- start:33 stop:473 length:441 start_codon:yes stop_codon:yes gene_type:complete